MSYLIGAVRITLVLLLVLGGAIGMLPLTLIPLRFEGARLSSWWITLLMRVFNRIFNIRFHCTNPGRMRWHHGLIFPNHSSYLDVIALCTTAPVRFLSAAEMRDKPVIGWMAGSVETVFVDRSSSQSRRAARRSISNVLQTNPHPPIVIFPEGKLDPGTSLYPFRHGAFELAVQNQVAFLPVALRYNRPDIVTWYGGLRHENMVTAVWRLARHRGRISVDVIPLEPVWPSAQDDAAILAAVAQRAVEQALGFAPSPTHLEAPVMPRPARTERKQQKSAS
jgi:1-acyl-sn-glycerol-3-phosphate acyltransferase